MPGDKINLRGKRRWGLACFFSDEGIRAHCGSGNIAFWQRSVWRELPVSFVT